MAQTQQFYGRSLARSQALQLLFQAEARKLHVSDILGSSYLITEGPLQDFARTLALGTDSIRDELDALIQSVATNWSLDRILQVDRNIIRLAIFEMVKLEDVDIAVAINESVELAKAYGTDESAAFVNGILGKVARRIQAGEDVLATCTHNATSETPSSIDNPDHASVDTLEIDEVLGLASRSRDGEYQ